ncbi:hypothetical protein N7494_010087 [Penicillium frequentans]|uniref:Nucleoside phosphorylase domain-containing protein n=1 Tax=Penicillium frequentans TaxID=3151616 RepID=A0AAD6CRI4_9EURO|nr:hypothetical protein N7494_010087 [Penicillium glabrum]
MSRSQGHPKPKFPISQFDYTVGWICVIPAEYFEATKVFDERYSSDDIVPSRGDQSKYDLGRIGEHDVVINCPAAGTYGQIDAAMVATDMKSTFPAIRFVLLVGIGEGRQ